MSKDNDPGVPLEQYRQLQAGVLVICLDCALQRVFGLEAVIRQLQARGVGGPQTGIRALAALVRDPCPKCGRRRFETRPYFQPGRPKT